MPGGKQKSSGVYCLQAMFFGVNNVFWGESTNWKGMSEFLKMEAASSLVLQCSGEQNFEFLNI